MKFSWLFIKEHIQLAGPLVISTLLSGSAQYIDGIIVSAKFPPERFAIFRYGAKEMPFVVSLAIGLNNAMLSQFSSIKKMKFSLLTLKIRSLRLMHILFPVSILLLLFSNDIFPAVFTQRFQPCHAKKRQRKHLPACGGKSDYRRRSHRRGFDAGGKVAIPPNPDRLHTQPSLRQR